MGRARQKAPGQTLGLPRRNALIAKVYYATPWRVSVHSRNSQKTGEAPGAVQQRSHPGQPVGQWLKPRWQAIPIQSSLHIQNRMWSVNCGQRSNGLPTPGAMAVVVGSAANDGEEGLLEGRCGSQAIKGNTECN